MIVSVQKLENEGPVPTIWRPTIVALIACIVREDYDSVEVIRDLEQIEHATIIQITTCLIDYGKTLVNLPEETWDTSVYIWYGSYWEVLIDLYTLEEGRSDMVLSLKVKEIAGTFKFQVHLVYVP